MRRYCLLGILVAFTFQSLMAQGPKSDPRQEGTIKATVSVDLGQVFKEQMRLVEKRRGSWFEKAEKATPELFRTGKKPVSLVKVEKDTASFQGWKVVPSGKVETVCNRPMQPGDSFILDFGEHFTGQFIFVLRRFDIPVDAPVRLAFIFAEVPAELGEPFDPYPGSLTRAWLQDEVINVDDVPQEIKLPRRYAFRYVKITVVSCSRHGKFGFSDIRAEAATSADEKNLLEFTPQNVDEKALDDVSCRTLRDCMQTVFEDGPKRDRRLWLGDLRLQALANYATYRFQPCEKVAVYSGWNRHGKGTGRNLFI